MDWTELDWTALDRLRETFLAGEKAGNYWRRASDLASYDATYGRRIAWKWHAVLCDLARLPWRPTPRAGHASLRLLDWGCGTGIAARSVLDAWGPDTVEQVAFYDQSGMAARFAAEQTRTQYPNLPVSTPVSPPAGPREAAPAEDAVDMLLLSHVINELPVEAMQQLLDLCRSARSIIWVEPGTHADSRLLIAAREQLRETFNIVAPCTHQAGCGLLTEENQPHWCHFFALPPAGIMGDSDWVRFGQRAGIDLRSVPYSYLVLERKDVAAAAPPASTSSHGRILGSPRVYKPHARVYCCQADGVFEYEAMKRDVPEFYRACRKGAQDTLYQVTKEGLRIRELRSCDGPDR